MAGDFAENDATVEGPSFALTSDNRSLPIARERSPSRRPDMDISEHDDSLASPSRNPVFAIKTITIHKQQPSENSGEITDETSRTTRTEEEDEETQEISDPGDEISPSASDPSSSHPKTNAREGQRPSIQRIEKRHKDLYPVDDELNNDASSTQSPFSVPTVDLFPVDSNHSILTNDESITSFNISKRSNSSLVLSPSVSQRARSMNVFVGTPGGDQDKGAPRRNPRTPATRPVERTNSFILRRNKRLEQIKQRVMSKKQQRLMEENRQLEQVQEDAEGEDDHDDAETFLHHIGPEMLPLKSPSTSSHKKVLQTVSPRKTPSKHKLSPSSSPSSSSPETSSSTPRRCLSTDRGRKERHTISVRDNSPRSTRSESRKTPRNTHDGDRSSRRSRSRSDRAERSHSQVRDSPESPVVSTPTRASKNISISVVVPQSPGSQGSSQYRNHRQTGNGLDHLEEELTAANLIISQQQEQIKSLQQSNEDLQKKYDEAQCNHEKQLQGSLHALYQMQKKQEKTEQDLQLALKKINSLNELHNAVAKIQQLTGLQLLSTPPAGDDLSIKSDGAKSAVSAKSAPQLGASHAARTGKKDPLPLVEESPINYISDASDSTSSELLNDFMAESGEYVLEENMDEISSESFPNKTRALRRYSGSNIPEKAARSAEKKRGKSPSMPRSYAPVVPSRQDQSQASYLDSALHRKVSESSPRRYSLQH